MPKRVFWPLTLITMGLIFLASNMGYLPTAFWDLWPIILIVVGLGGLLTADREEWAKPSSAQRSPVASKSTTKKKIRRS